MPCYVVEENVAKGKEVWRVENYPLAYIIRSLIKHVITILKVRINLTLVIQRLVNKGATFLLFLIT